MLTLPKIKTSMRELHGEKTRRRLGEGTCNAKEGFVPRTYRKKSQINKKMETTVENQEKTCQWRRSQINL